MTNTNTLNINTVVTVSDVALVSVNVVVSVVVKDIAS